MALYMVVPPICMANPTIKAIQETDILAKAYPVPANKLFLFLLVDVDIFLGYRGKFEK